MEDLDVIGSDADLLRHDLSERGFMALALGLGTMAKGQKEIGLFFIDEGFGALDKQSLRLVFEALRALRSEKRIVGIISHVEDLQEDIDTYLKITNAGEAGSVVETSW